MSEVQRGPAAGDWRAGAGAIVVLTVEVDGESALLGGDERHADDLSAMSHQAYGPRVGLPRILQLAGQFGVPATFFVPGAVVERWPKAVEAIALAGHEVALHGHAHRSLTQMSAQEQRADLERGVEALGRVGIEPRGYRAPFFTLTATTLHLLAGAGITYDSSLMDDDRPYRLRTEGGSLAELPAHWVLDDSPAYWGGSQELPATVAETWIAELDGMRATGSLCVLTVHDFLTGRPSRIRALERFLAAARERGDVRFARGDRVAEVVGGAVPALRP